MFKKLGLVVLAMLLMFGTAQAARVLNSNIMDSTFNDVTTAANSTVTIISGYEKVAFFVVYDETEVGNSISAAITCQISYDGTNYQSASFYDYAGGATLQTSETISADGRYYFWFNRDITAPYVRVVATLTNTDADDVCNVKAYIVAKE